MGVKSIILMGLTISIGFMNRAPWAAGKSRRTLKCHVMGQGVLHLFIWRPVSCALWPEWQKWSLGTSLSKLVDGFKAL